MLSYTDNEVEKVFKMIKQFDKGNLLKPKLVKTVSSYPLPRVIML